MRHTTPLAVLVLLFAVAGCAAVGAGPSGKDPRQIPPTGSSAYRPPPLPDRSVPGAPPLLPVTPVAGAKARAATWKLAGGGQGRVLDLDVTVGGPPCDAVTGVDVRESPTTVAVTVYAGPIPTADCRGVPAITGTVRVRVTLGEPLGSRRLITE